MFRSVAILAFHIFDKTKSKKNPMFFTSYFKTIFTMFYCEIAFLYDSFCFNLHILTNRMKNGQEVFSLYNFQKNQRIYWYSNLHAEYNYKSYKSDALTTAPLQLVLNKLPIACILSLLHYIYYHGTTVVIMEQQYPKIIVNPLSLISKFPPSVLCCVRAHHSIYSVYLCTQSNSN